MSALIPGYAGDIVTDGAPIDWTGSYVPDSQQYYAPYIQIINGQRTQGPQVLNPNYKPPGTAGTPAIAASAPPPPHLKFSFDTIGQPIIRSIGSVRLPLRPIWAQGIDASGDETISDTQTFAAALCAPIDVLEEGEIFSIYDGGSEVYNSGTVIAPLNWSASDIALLGASLGSIQIFPGDEAQLQASLIVADKGASRVNAFRGIRYLILPNYPINGSGGNGIPQMSAVWQRTNDGGSPQEENDTTAVQFFAGSS
jgi:hypothetical protein